MADPVNQTTLALLSTDRRKAMGVECVVSVSGNNSPIVVQRCLDLIEELEQLWSRFLPHSDINKLNSAHGEPVWVDPRTIQLIQHMVSAHSATQGAFNPTLLPLQIAAGDTQSLVDSRQSVVPAASVTTDDLTGITAHPDGRVSLPINISLDAGGIAKGFAADLVKDQAMLWGATDVCVNIGGDIAMHSNSESGWNVDILSPIDRSVVETISIQNGAVATSAINARNRNGQNLLSHIFSQSPQKSPQALGASVIAHTAAWAEAWTKFAILMPTATAIQEFEALNLAALIVDQSGATTTTSTWKDFIL